MIRRLVMLFALLALVVLCSGRAGAQPVLDGVPTPGLVHVQPGSTVQLLGSLQNLSGGVIYIRGVSYAAVGTFAGTVSLVDFAHAKPDSLRPGDRWEGPLARIVVPAGPGTNSAHRLDFVVMGGVHRYDSQIVAEFTFGVDDSLPALGIGDRPQVPLTTSFDISPNPGAGETTMRFVLPRDGLVDLRIVDLLGRTRRVLHSGQLAAGSHERQWDGRDAAGTRLAPGVYFVRLTRPEGVLRRKLVRIE